MTHQVTITREDNLWVAEIPGVGATDVEHFPDLDVEVRDYIAGMTDTDPDELDLEWCYEINGRDVTNALGRFLAVERELSQRLAEREEARMRAMRELTEAGLSRRATGDVVGLTGGRVQQLVG